MVKWTLSFCMLLLAADAHAGIGRVINLQGEASITRQADGGYARIELERGMSLLEGDQLRTRRDSSVRIVFLDRSLLSVGENASVVVQNYEVQNTQRRRKVGIKIWAGRAWARVSKWFGGGENNYELRTPNAVAGVRGTEFSVDVSTTGETSVTVFEGSVEVGAPDGGQTFDLLGQGQRSRVAPEGTAVTETVAPRELEKARREAQNTSGPQAKNENGQTKATDNSRNRESKNQRSSERGQAGNAPPPPESTPIDAPPPLDLDPASGRSRVRGRVELRE